MKTKYTFKTGTAEEQAREIAIMQAYIPDCVMELLLQTNDPKLIKLLKEKQKQDGK